LESSKWKHKASEGVSEAEIQAALSLAQLGKNKLKKSMKNIAISKVQRVPSSVDTIDDLHPTGFSSYLWRDLRFNVHSRCTPGSMLKLLRWCCWSLEGSCEAYCCYWCWRCCTSTFCSLRWDFSQIY
jgi:hypothetical protein